LSKLPELPDCQTGTPQDFIRFIEALRSAILGLETAEKLLRGALIASDDIIDIGLKCHDFRAKANLYKFGFTVAGVHKGGLAIFYVAFFNDESVEIRLNDHSPEANILTFNSWEMGYSYALARLRDFIAFLKRTVDLTIPER
jgi:hypothetical protein